MSPKESEDSVSLRPSEQRMDVLLTRLKLEEMSQKHHYHLPQLVSKEIKGPCPFFFKIICEKTSQCKGFLFNKNALRFSSIEICNFVNIPAFMPIEKFFLIFSYCMRWHDVLSDDQFRNGAIRVSTTLRFLWSKTLSFDKL